MITITVYDDDDNEVEYTLPATNEVCDRCEGHGTHSNPNIDGNGITASEWAEWHPDEQDAYINGEYDVTCEKCHGNNVITVPDTARMSQDQLKIFHQWEKQEAERASNDAEWNRENEMEAWMMGEF